MNERIKELWNKAAESTAAYPSGQNNSWETQVNFMDKFAELIVKECLEQIDKIRDGCDSDNEDQQALGADWAGLAVARHFGVE